MPKLSDETKPIVASNLTLAAFIFELTQAVAEKKEFRTDINDCIRECFEEFKASLDK